MARAGRHKPALERTTPVGLEQRLALRLHAAALSNDARLVVGFSGGVDSLALAAALSRVVGDRSRLVLAHVDHGLRSTSADEARAAAALADALALPFRLMQVPEGLVDRAAGIGVEEAARRGRYLALAACVREAAAAALVLAHHRDDQAETVLLHLLRGAGVAGAAGMAEWTRRAVPWWSKSVDAGTVPSVVVPDPIVLWRPLLSEPRAALSSYVASLALAPVADPTNDDRGFRRNRVRHDLLPALERTWPGAASALARYARLAADDDAALDAVASGVLREARAADGLRVDRVAREALAIRRRVVRRWLAESAPPLEVSAERTEAVVALLAPGRGRRTVEVGGGWAATVRAGVVGLERAGEGEAG